jgi:hypothetical protein
MRMNRRLLARAELCVENSDDLENAVHRSEQTLVTSASSNTRLIPRTLAMALDGKPD